ncbi:8-oxo-dGTP diphosphatase MutT [Legionella dresdenensis]|uniref:8-oxo-dGTP diphosphatase n=1 Tax=Legionella dresdenensis TaxID=450200 RepID=A0ABV8CC56_9GAMM
MKVAVAVIFDRQQRILITQRPLKLAHGGQWEFPGGKLEPDESPEAALIREVKEEVGLLVTSYKFLCEINHDYGSKHVSLLVYTIDGFEGNAQCLEGQPGMNWVAISELGNYQFPEANSQIIEKLTQ